MLKPLQLLSSYSILFGICLSIFKYYTPVHVCIVQRPMCVWWAHEMVLTLGLLLCLYTRTERKRCPAGILLLPNKIQADNCDFFLFSFLRATLKARR